MSTLTQTRSEHDAHSSDFKVNASKFELRDDAVYERKERLGKEEWVKICSPLEVTAWTRDSESDDWGRRLEWKDADGEPHEWVMRQSLLSAGNRDVVAALLSGGLVIEPDMQKSVIEYIQSRKTDARIVIAPETGWHDGVFILPDVVIPQRKNGSEIRYAPTAGPGEHGYGVHGTVDDWKHDVGRLCQNNSRALFGVSAALSAPTLDMLEEEGGGFHFYGVSSCGKTTLLEAAGSVWGGGGTHGFRKSWRSTSNGLELIAAAHNDCCLILDELGQLDAKEAEKVAYLLAGGQAKNRMNPNGSGQQPKSWRIQFLSSGEITIDQLASSVGAKTRGGMAVRMIDIPADAGKGLGAWEDLHGMADGAQFAVRLKEAARTYYGAVGREWLAYLVMDRDGYAELLREHIQRFEQAHMPKRASAEVARVVHRFAVIAAAGELANELGLTGWEPGEASRGVATCLAAWLDHRGGAHQGHDAGQMLRQVRHFIQSHQTTRFQYLPKKKQSPIPISDQEPRFTGPVRNAAGYYRTEKNTTTYYFYSEVFSSEVCKGFDHTQVLEALKSKGHLVHDSGRSDKQMPTSGKDRERFYAVKGSILFTTDEGDGD